MSIVPATQETEAKGLLQPMNLKLPWETLRFISKENWCQQQLQHLIFSTKINDHKIKKIDKNP
jgi:hypothetical protein